MSTTLNFDQWEISPLEDTIYSTDVEARWKELQEEAGERDLDESEAKELNCLSALIEQGRGFDDWNYGATLISDRTFIEHAQDLAEEMDMIPSEYTWPISCIDWEKAAWELKMDYSSVEFAGNTYWIR